MQRKYAVTIGLINDKPVVIDGPSDDVTGMVDSLDKLTNDAGKTKVGGKEVTVDEAVILHTTKGVIKRRKDITGSKKRAIGDKAETLPIRAREAAAKAKAEKAKAAKQ